MSHSFAATLRCVLAGLAAAMIAFAILSLSAVASAAPSRADQSAVPGMTGRFILKMAGGRDVTETSFPGKWLIYFGYTLCPDACPTALNAIAAALADLGPLAGKVQPLFITVDPKRDTPQVIADYVKAFDPHMLGLSGTDVQTVAAAKAFHVYYQVRQLGGGEYAIDHSSFIYIMNPGGQVVELLTGNLPAPAIAAALRNFVK
jgi:protein SCO1/2